MVAILNSKAGLVAALSSLVSSVSGAIQYDGTSTSAIAAANVIKDNMMTFYTGTQYGHTVGAIDGPFYWWEGGAMFGQLIQHWSLTGNDSLNSIVSAGIIAQAGPNSDFQTQNWTAQLGNDDQAFWAFTAMDGAETNFPAPPNGTTGWLGMAQGVFNRQVVRWDPTSCGGGLRWQVESFNTGYDYKNTPANGGLSQLSARLARYTQNQTYSDWAEKLWDWELNVGYILGSAAGNGFQAKYNVFDGGHIEHNCTDINRVQFTYNAGTLLSAAAYMYDYTKSPTWLTRTQLMLEGILYQFVIAPTSATNDEPAFPNPSGTILSETADEFQTPQAVSYDQPAFKAFLVRSLAITSLLVPSLATQIQALIKTSAAGAATQCSGTGYSGQPTGNWCGRRWYQTAWDGENGLGEQMSAMSVFQNTLVASEKLPYAESSGGTSQGDVSAGTGASASPIEVPEVYSSDITGADEFGAAVLTILGVVLAVAGTWFMVR